MWEPSRNEASRLSKPIEKHSKGMSLDLVIKPVELEVPVPVITIRKDSPLGKASMAGDLSL